MKKIVCLLNVAVLTFATAAYANGYNHTQENKSDLSKSYTHPHEDECDYELDSHKSFKHTHHHTCKSYKHQHKIYKHAYQSDYKPAPYLGVQAGWARIDEGDGFKQYINSLPGHNIELGTFTGWRGMAGYSLTPYFSAEAGYNYYPDNNYTSNTDSINTKSYTIDLVGKFILPLEKTNIKQLARFSIYGKVGGSYVHTVIEKTLGGVFTKVRNNTIRPTYGAGIAFNFTDNISFDASWTGVYGKNRISSSDIATVNAANPTPNCNLFALGVYYNFAGIF